MVSDGGCWFVKVVSLKGDKGEAQWLLWRWKKVKCLVVGFIEMVVCKEVVMEMEEGGESLL